MCSSQQPLAGADSEPVTYRVAIRSAVSDETFSRNIRVWGPRDLEHQMAQLREDYGPDYDLGLPRKVA
jgi:hypothetical protein